MRPIRTHAAAAAIVLAWAATLPAGPLDLNSVPADAKWLAHVDFDAGRNSPVVQRLLEQCGREYPGIREGVLRFCEKAGLDQCNTLHGVTAYGTTLKPRSGVMVIRAKWDVDTLRAAVEKAPRHRTSQYGKYTIHSFTAHKGSRRTHTVAATLQAPEVLVFASSEESLKSALDVLDGKGASLSGKDSPLAVSTSPGAIFVARAVDLKDAPAVRVHPELELIRSLQYEEGQDGAQWFGNITATAVSPDAAQKLGKVFEGLGAWLSLHGHKYPWFAEMLNKVKLQVDGNAVKVTFRESADALAARMPDFCKAIREHIEAHGEMRKMYGDRMDRKDREMHRRHPRKSMRCPGTR